MLKEKFDSVVQLLLIIFLSMWVGCLIASETGVKAIQTYFLLTVAFLSIWILDVAYHLLRARRLIRQATEKLKTPYIPAILLLLLTLTIIFTTPSILPIIPTIAPPEAIPIIQQANYTPQTATLTTLTITLLTLTTIRTYTEKQAKTQLTHVKR